MEYNSMEKFVCSHIYADVSYGKSRYCNEICYNVDFYYKSIENMERFNDLIKMDRGYLDDKYQVLSKVNIYDSGKNGIVEMMFHDEKIVNQYLKKFVTQCNACVTIGEINPLCARYGKYEEQVMLKKLIEIKEEYVKHRIIDDSWKDKQFTI